MNKKIFLAAVLAVCLTLTLCACGGETAGPAEEPTTTTTTTTTAATTTTTAAPTAPTPGEGQVLYSVKVVDAAGAPVNAYVQLCLETCVFSGTDAEGMAYFTLPEADYKVTIIGDPSATEYHFEAGSHELTLTYDAGTATTASTENSEEPMTNDVELEW